MIRTIVFDYGGVITTKKRSRLIADWAHNQFGADPKKVFEVFNSKEGAHAYSKGAISKQTFYQRVIDQCRLPCTVEQLSAQFAIFNAPDSNMEELLIRLADQIDLCLISDSMPELTADIKRRFSKVFRVAVFSDEEKCLKDEGKLFHIGFKKIGTPPRECLYVDDRPEKLNVPKGLGATTLLFHNYGQFKLALKMLMPGLNIR